MSRVVTKDNYPDLSTYLNFPTDFSSYKALTSEEIDNYTSYTYLWDYSNNFDNTYCPIDDYMNFSLRPHELGDICYFNSNGNKLDFYPYSAWTSSLGTPLAVCVIPTSHAKAWGDGKARFMSIHGLTTGGTSATSETYMVWSKGSTDSPLTNYNRVPTWSNTVSGTTGSNTSGFMSSDKFTGGTTNVNDTISKYSQTSNLIPSPFYRWNIQ